ncbi:MAG: class I SAM-dependent methyltransferase [Amaricoccus sp.]
MTDDARHDAWTAGDSYEAYMGRWSRQVAARFLDRLGVAAGADWIEVGCGTGALTAAIVARAAPRSVLAVEPSEAFLAGARASVADPRVRFEPGRAEALPAADAAADVAVSGLVLNFVADRPAALREMRRVLRPDGRLAFYVWDYPGGGLAFVDAFWKAAAELDPAAAGLDEARRFGFCTRDALAADCVAAGLDPEVVPLTIPTPFADFDDYWRPFTLGAGPAPGYCTTLDAGARTRLRDRLRALLGAGPVAMQARAWAVECRPAETPRQKLTPH